MTTRFADHLPTGDHASRPAATALPDGSLYSCTDHGLIYQTDGATWSTWATLGGDVSAHLADTTDAHDASAISFSPTGTIAATDVQAAIAEVASEAGGSSSAFLDYAELFGTGAVSISKANTSLTAVDGTNLKLDANWPASGAAMFEFTGAFTYGRECYFYLATAAAPTTVIRYIAYRSSAQGSDNLCIRSKLTGTPGAAFSIVIGWEGGAGTTSLLTHGDSGNGPLTFTVAALP